MAKRLTAKTVAPRAPPKLLAGGSVGYCAIIASMVYDFGMTWRVEILDAIVAAELSCLPEDSRASFARISRMIASHGLERLREPYVKHLQGKLWEMRLRGKDGIARALYVTATGRRVVVLHVFVKKTQKTPRRHIDLALQRAEGIE